MEAYRAVGHREAAHQKTFHSGITRGGVPLSSAANAVAADSNHPALDPRGVMEKSSKERLAGRSAPRSKRVLARCARIALVRAVFASVCACRGETAAAQETPVTSEDSVKIDGASWTPCAAEYERCSFDGAKKVLYGTPDKHVIKTFTGGTGCDNGVFDDPAPGASKHCWVEAVAESAAARFVAGAPPPSTPLAMQCSPAAAPVDAPASGDTVEA